MSKLGWKRLTRGCACMAAIVLGARAASAADLVGLITKTEVPYYINMRQGAEEKAKALGLELRSFSGKDHGDNESQVAAIESLIAAGAKGIVIVPADPAAIGPSIKKARDKGILVIALDTPLDPPTTADATFATDNRLAGKLIGQWAAAQLGKQADTARVALLDFSPEEISVDYLRDTGFLQGFGIPVYEPNHWGSEKDPRICGHFMTGANEEGGRTGMEQALQKCPDLKVVYTINEPTAAGAYEALKAVGKNDGSILLVSIDGGCDGVKNVKSGALGATSMQFPKLMASMALEAIVKYIKTGDKPVVTPGLDFTNTGTELITDKPISAVPSVGSSEGLKKCWG